MIGQVLDNRYRIEGQLGQGGVGQVYLASHVRTGRKCAVKFLTADAALDQSMVKRFEREARTLGSLGHPGIVGVHDFAETPEGRPYIVMDYLEGEDLSLRLKRGGPMRWETAGVIFEQIAAALSAAHRAGVLHRDLKPGNVYLARTAGDAQRVVILDFGLAKRYTEDEPHLTKTGALLGTPFYMSPEQARGKGVDLRSDIYALGAILYQMLTGRPPFEGATLTEVLAQILTEPPPQVSTAAPHPVPAHLDEVLATAMAKDPAKRFPHLAAFASAVLQEAPDWARNASLGYARTDTHDVQPAQAQTPAQTHPAPVSSVPSETPMAQSAQPPQRRGLTWIVILGMIGSAAIAAVIAVLVARSTGKSGEKGPKAGAAKSGSPSSAPSPAPSADETPKDPMSSPSITIGGGPTGSGSITIGQPGAGRPRIVVGREGVVITPPPMIPGRKSPFPEDPKARSEFMEMINCTSSRNWKKCADLARKFPRNRLALNILISSLVEMKDIKALKEACGHLEKVFPNDPFIKQCWHTAKKLTQAARIARKTTTKTRRKRKKTRGGYRD